MKKGDIVWYFTAGHELRFGEIIRKDEGKYVVKDGNKIVRRKRCQLAVKEERCKKSTSCTS